jgi:hypothetical protein
MPRVSARRPQRMRRPPTQTPTGDRSPAGGGESARVVVTVDAIEVSAAHAALLETGVPSRRDRGRYGRASRGSNSLWPWTIRSPRITRLSEGKPLRRLLVTSKAGLVVECVFVVCHTKLLRGVFSIQDPWGPSAQKRGNPSTWVRMAPAVARFPSRLERPVQGHRGAYPRLERSLVDVVPLVDIESAPDVAFKTRVEQS